MSDHTLHIFNIKKFEECIEKAKDKKVLSKEDAKHYRHDIKHAAEVVETLFKAIAGAIRDITSKSDKLKNFLKDHKKNSDAVLIKKLTKFLYDKINVRDSKLARETAEIVAEDAFKDEKSDHILPSGYALGKLETVLPTSPKIQELFVAAKEAMFTLEHGASALAEILEAAKSADVPISYQKADMPAPLHPTLSDRTRSLKDTYARREVMQTRATPAPAIIPLLTPVIRTDDKQPVMDADGAEPATRWVDTLHSKKGKENKDKDDKDGDKSRKLAKHLLNGHFKTPQDFIAYVDGFFNRQDAPQKHLFSDLNEHQKHYSRKRNQFDGLNFSSQTDHALIEVLAKEDKAANEGRVSDAFAAAVGRYQRIHYLKTFKPGKQKTELAALEKCREKLLEMDSVTLDKICGALHHYTILDSKKLNGPELLGTHILTGSSHNFMTHGNAALFAEVAERLIPMRSEGEEHAALKQEIRGRVAQALQAVYDRKKDELGEGSGHAEKQMKRIQDPRHR